MYKNQNTTNALHHWIEGMNQTNNWPINYCSSDSICIQFLILSECARICFTNLFSPSISVWLYCFWNVICLDFSFLFRLVFQLWCIFSNWLAQFMWRNCNRNRNWFNNTVQTMKSNLMNIDRWDEFQIDMHFFLLVSVWWCGLVWPRALCLSCRFAENRFFHHGRR